MPRKITKRVTPVRPVTPRRPTKRPIGITPQPRTKLKTSIR